MAIHGTKLSKYICILWILSATQADSHSYILQVLHSLTSACRWLLAPLAAGLALSCGGSFQGVAFVAGEAHHIIVVEAIAYGAAVDGATRVATCNS